MMRCFALCFFAFASPCAAQLPEAPKPVEGSLLDRNAADVAGTWRVALDYDDGSEPMEEELVISSASGANMQGGFLGSIFVQSALRKQGQDMVFFATTDDADGPVYHSGRFQGDVIQGQSYFSGRALLLPWTGYRAEN
ncbi:MAG: hypothetical protein AAGA36_04465 [Pseudomonadota bacterium]